MAVDQDAFLACCFRNCKEKPNIDFDEVAKETGMSVGGAKNKHRDILKKLENSTVDKKVESGKDEQKPANKTKSKVAKDKPIKTGTKRKTAASVKREPFNASENEEEHGSMSYIRASKVEEDGAEASESESSPRKKQRTMTKSSTSSIRKHTKAKSKTALGADNINNEDDGGEDSTDIEVGASSALTTKKKIPKSTAMKNGTATKANGKDDVGDKVIDSEAPAAKPKKPSQKGRGKGAKLAKEVNDTNAASDSEVETEQKVPKTGRTTLTAKSRGRPAKGKKKEEEVENEKPNGGADEKEEDSDIEVPESSAPKPNTTQPGHAKKPSTNSAPFNTIEVIVPPRPAAKPKSPTKAPAKAEDGDGNDDGEEVADDDRDSDDEDEK